MPSEQDESLGGDESASASGNQPISLPLFGVQPQNIVPLDNLWLLRNNPF